MRPWFDRVPAWQAYTGLFFLTDATCLIAMRAIAQMAGRDIAVYFGAASAIMTGWLAATGAGYFIGGFIADRRGTDLTW